MIFPLGAVNINNAARGTKTIVALWHCHPEIFCVSGKFLRITLEIALESFQTVSKFLNGLESFQMVWKVSRRPGNLPDGQEIFWLVWEVFKWSGKFQNGLERFRVVINL